VLGRLYYDTLTHSARSLSWLVEFAGSDRVLLGSDFPFPTGDSAAVRAVAGAVALTPAERAAILGGNACRLFGC
jgi:aminocarboxymuconate-semialdehyde decarboxylase